MLRRSVGWAANLTPNASTLTRARGMMTWEG